MFDLGCCVWYVNDDVWIWIEVLGVVCFFDEVFEYLFGYCKIGDYVVF